MGQQAYVPAGYWQATVTFTGAALPHGAAIVLHGANSPTPTSVASIAGLVIAALRRAPAFGIQAGPFNTGRNLSNQVNLASVIAKLGPLATGASFTQVDGGPIGSGAGDPLPPNVAVLVHKATSLGGRRGRGRIYVPGATEAQVGAAGMITAGELTAMQNAWGSFYDQMVLDQLPLCIAHHYNPAVGPVPPVPTPIDVLTVEPQVATQRDRLRR